MKHNEERIVALMVERSISRKSAVQYLRRKSKLATTLPSIEEMMPVTTALLKMMAVDIDTPVVSVESVPQEAPAPISVAFPDDEPLFTTALDNGGWNPARAVELFKGGMKIIDIAVEMGYTRGNGCNRTKATLKKAGLL